MHKTNSGWLMIVLIAIAALATVAPIYINGIPNGNDLPQHYQFGIVVKEALADGTIYPGWSPSVNSGFGDVGIRFYPPLSYYVLAGFEILTGNWYDGSILTFAFWFFLGGIGVYQWARESFSDRSAFFAAICYIVAPYHVNELFNAFTYAEFAAASILPFCFLYATRVCKYRKAEDILLLGLSYGLLVLTHLPMTVIGSISLFAFSLASLKRSDFVRQGLRLAAGACLGLTISSFYWVRMATELQFVRHATTEFRSVAYDYHVNFLAGFLYVSPIEYDERTLWFADLMLVMTLCLFLPGLILIILRWKKCEVAAVKASLVTIGLSLFFATPLSLTIWERVTVLQQIQFPWRWLSIITLMGSYMAAANFEPLIDAFRTKLRPIAIVAIGLIIAAVTFTGTQVIKPAIYKSREDFKARTDRLHTAESYECWWPIWASKSALDDPAQITATDRNVTIEHYGRYARDFTISGGEPTKVRVATFYYPLWSATVNGRDSEVHPDQSGVISIPISGTESKIHLRFQEPAFISVINKLSILSFGFILAGLGYIRFAYKRKN